jgi:hypothetical protein
MRFGRELGEIRDVSTIESIELEFQRSTNFESSVVDVRIYAIGGTACSTIGFLFY